MPYLQGYGLEDASAVTLGDASAVALAEPNLDFGTIQQAAQYTVGPLAGYIIETLIAAFATEIVAKIVGTNNAITLTGIYNDTELIRGYLGYNLWPERTVADDFDTLTEQLVAQIGVVTDAISAVQGAGGHTIEEIYLLPNIDADTIWQWRPSVGDEQMYTLLQDAGRFGSRVADLGALPVQNAPGFLLTGPWAASDANELPTDYPAVDWSGIAADDTIESYLDRADPAHNWTTDTNTGMVAAESTHANSVGWYWMCRFTPGEFEKLKAAQATASNVPPAWPGVANATLGEAVALAAGVTINEPMDGVLIEITSVPAGTGRYVFDDQSSWMHLGAVAFYTDNDDIEQGQSFSFEHHIIVPKTMVRAAGCVLRCKSGVVGTVTPWTVTA